MSGTHATLGGNAQLTGIGAIGQSTGPIYISSGFPEPRPPLAHSLQLKFQADRHEQERVIREHLIEYGQSLRPIAFIVHGSPSQLVEGFVQRLYGDIIPKQLHAILTNNSDSTEREPVRWDDTPWPQLGRHSASGEERLADYLEGLTRVLMVSPHAGLREIADRIARMGQPLVLTSIHTENPDDDDSLTLGSVLGWWAGLPDLATALRLVIVVAINYAEVEPGFVARLLARPTPISPLQKRLAAFHGWRSPQLKVVVLPALGDVTVRDVEYWVRNVLRPDDREVTLKRAREIFGRKRDALPMAQLDRHLESLVPAGRPRFRTE